MTSSTLNADSRRGSVALGFSFAYLLWVLAGYWKIAPMSITAGLAAAAWAIAAWRPPGPRWVRSPTDWGGIAWGLALILSACFAVDRSASLPRLAKVLFPFLVGVSAWHARDPRTGRRAAGLILASASLAALYGIVVFVIRGASFASRARGPVGHYLTFAGQLAIAGSLAIAILLVTRDRRWKWAALVAVALCGAALAATFSRSSWIGLAVAAALMTALARPKWLIPGAVLLALGVLFAPGDYRARLVSIFDPGNRWNEQRTLMWEAGLRMFRDHPVTGVGLQDLHALYERYRSPGAWEPAGHLHSVPVQVAATMGVVGLVALAVLAVSLALTVGHGLRARLRDGDLGAAVQLGAAGALAAFAVAGLFEWNLGDEEVLHPLYALIGLAWASREWTARREVPR